MARLLKYGGQQIGTELHLLHSTGGRLMQPLEDDGVGHLIATLTEMSPNQIWRPTFTLWHEESTDIAFEKWMLRTMRMFRAGAQDVTVWDNGSLQLTYPKCSFVDFRRPVPSDPATARYSDQVTIYFLSNREPRL